MDKLSCKLRKKEINSDKSLIGVIYQNYQKISCKKGYLRISKNYIVITITAIAVKVTPTYILLRDRSQHKIEKILRKKSEQFSKKSLLNFTDSDNPLDHRRSTSKNSWGDTTVRRFLQGIRFHTKRKDGANFTYIWCPPKNCYSYNVALQKHESNLSFNWWRHWFLRHCRWGFAGRYIRILFIYTLPRLSTLNILRSNKRKWFHTEKGKKQMISHKNYDKWRLRKWESTYRKNT